MYSYLTVSKKKRNEDVETGVDYPGNDYSILADCQMTKEKCSSNCHAVSNCQAWTFIGQTDICHNLLYMNEFFFLYNNRFKL